MVGQRMVELLDAHPWFRLVAVAASERSVGRTLAEAAPWRLPGEMPKRAAGLVVRPCEPSALPSGVRLVLSALDASVAGGIETAFRDAGHAVVTNAGALRGDPAIPLVVPEVNPHHLALLDRSGASGGGYVVANPNCCVIPLVMVLAPLHRAFGVRAVTVATWQAVSGAGYPGESAWDMVANVHPHPGSEEAKLATEPLKILGTPEAPADFPISARSVRVPVADGHLLGVHMSLRGDPSPRQVADCLRAWNGNGPELPSSPRPLLRLTDRRDRPSPRFDAGAGRGMAVTVGRIEPCPVLGVKLYALAHNTIRGAAGAAIANAELLVKQGRV